MTSAAWDSEPATPTVAYNISGTEEPHSASEPPVYRFVDYGAWAGASSSINIITKATLLKDFQFKPAKVRLQEEAVHTVGLNAASKDDRHRPLSVIQRDRMNITGGFEPCPTPKENNVLIDGSPVSIQFSVF